MVFLASWNDVCFTAADNESSSDCSLTLMYALAGREGFAGLKNKSV